ncbi:hypothetical protein P4S70_01705 [Enterovibrio sp. Hal110]
MRSEKREARSEKREARSEKREARSEKREARKRDVLRKESKDKNAPLSIVLSTGQSIAD